MRNVPQAKWGKTVRRCFHWSTNTRPYQGRILRHSTSRWRKDRWDSFTFLVKGFLGNRRAHHYEELVNNLLQSYQNLGCNMSEKYTSFTRIWIFFPRELWCSEWWTWRTFRSTHFFSGEAISRKMELCYGRRLLLDFGKSCPYHGMQATGKKKFCLC